MDSDDRSLASPDKALVLACYGTGHAIVDAACAAMVHSSLRVHVFSPTGAWAFVMTYTLIAFATQAFFGMAVDRWRVPRLSAAVGCVLTAGAVGLVGFVPVPAICLAGVGNSLFHVGGGGICLNITPRRATAPGIFVAPGGIGLVLGTIVGQQGPMVGWPFVVLLAGMCITILALKTPAIDYYRPVVASEGRSFELILVLLLLAVAVRSLVGLTAASPWKSDRTWLITLTLAVAAGKAFGGILADRFGWLRVAVAAVLASAVLVAFGARSPYLGVPGMFLFQMAMPVTLTAVSRMFPGAPSFSFGLASLALAIGTMPVFMGFGLICANQWVTLLLILGSAGALLGGLRWFSKLGV